MTKILVSVYIRKGELILMENVDGDVSFRCEKYDNTDYAICGTVQSAEDTFLPIDPVQLQHYMIETDGYGKLTFTYIDSFNGGYIEHHRVPEHQLDIFTMYNKIVHVQGYEPKTIEDKIVDEALKTIKFSEHTPESFLETFEKICEKSNLDLEKIMDDISFNEPAE